MEQRTFFRVCLVLLVTALLLSPLQYVHELEKEFYMEIQARKYQITARHSWILPGPVVVGDNNTESLTKRQKSRMIYEKGDNAIGVCL